MDYHFDILSNEVAYSRLYRHGVQALGSYSILRELRFDRFLAYP